MNKLSIISTLFWLGSLLSVTAQHYRLDFVRDTNPWLSTDNAATLALLQVPDISEGQFSLRSEKGGFCNYTDPQSATTTQAQVESYYRILPRMVGYGRMSYQSCSQHKVAGSAFIDAQRMPFDIVEDSLSNEGNARKNVYNLAGGLSYDVLRHLSIGAKMDFTAADYAKYKDLRHKNSLTDLTLTAGLFAPLAPCLKLGVNAFYRRTVEGVTFGIYGSEDRVYKSLIDYGILTGEVETFGENGYTDKNTELPFVSEQKGICLQLGTATADDRLSWVSHFSYRRRKGYYGRDTSYDIVYNRHHGNLYQAASTLSFRMRSQIHQLLFDLDIENLQNDANTYRTIQDKQTSAYYYEYYTPVKMSNKVWANYQIGYRGYLGISDSIPRWSITAQYRHNQREQTMYYYPYARHQLLRANTLSATVGRNILLPKGLLTVDGVLSYRWGTGNICDDRLLATPSDKQREPEVMQTYLERDYQSFVAPQYTAGLGIRYSMPVPSARLTAYLQLNGAVSHVNGSASAVFEGNSRRSLNVSVGTIF